jgi:hypothetical protein
VQVEFMLKVLLFVLTAVVALAIPASSLATAKTTGPGSRLDVTIDLFDTTSKERYGQAFVVYLMTQSDYRGGLELFITDWTEVTRGEVAKITLRNKGKKLHTFKLFGTTKKVHPGRQAVFIKQLLKRGLFPYQMDKGTKGYKGIFTVN